MRRIGKVESPVVNKTVSKRHDVRSSRLVLGWAFVNLLLALAMYAEISSGSVFIYMNVLSVIHPVIWYAECGLAVLFGFNALWDLLRYLKSTLYTSPVILTNTQKKLLGVKPNEPGFKSTPPLPATSACMDLGPIFSPSSFTSSRGNSSFSGVSTPVPGGAHLSSYSSYSPSYSPTQPPFTPSPSGSPVGGHRTPSPSSRSPGGSPGHYSGQQQSGGGYMAAGYSPAGFAAGGGSFLDQSYGVSPAMGAGVPMTRGASPLSTTNTLSPLFREADTSGLRSRRHNVSVKSSPLMSEDCITDQRSLDRFLQEQREKEMRLQAASPDTSPGGGPSFWNFNRALSDYTPILRKYQYQIACRSPQQTKSKDDDTDEPTTYSADEVWSKVEVHPDIVDKWVENLRKWLCQTILARLVSEIDKINAMLARIGSEDMQIGEVSISTLKQLAVTKGQHVGSLNSLVPFLEVSSKQEYLVRRIRELGNGGSMSEFRWRGGGDYRGRPWSEHLPTDGAVLMHLLCTYMDSRLPPHPKYPDGKTFTSQHVLRTPDKPDLNKKDNLFIYQTKINPPHYKVVIEDDIWNPRKGRNNMFHAILLFLHYTKTKNHSMLGRVNLGMSGINILWVLEDL